MTLLYRVELETAVTFTARVFVKNEDEAFFEVHRLRRFNKNGRLKYSLFRLYDNFEVGGMPKLLKKWQ